MHAAGGRPGRRLSKQVRRKRGGTACLHAKCRGSGDDMAMSAHASFASHLPPSAPRPPPVPSKKDTNPDNCPRCPPLPSLPLATSPPPHHHHHLQTVLAELVGSHALRRAGHDALKGRAAQPAGGRAGRGGGRGRARAEQDGGGGRGQSRVRVQPGAGGGGNRGAPAWKSHPLHNPAHRMWRCTSTTRARHLDVCHVYAARCACCVLCRRAVHRVRRPAAVPSSPRPTPPHPPTHSRTWARGCRSPVPPCSTCSSPS